MSISDGLSPPKLPQWGRGGGPVTQGELVAALTQIWDYVLELTEQVTRIGEQQMSDQDTLNAVGTALAALAATVTSDDAGLTADVTAIQAEIAALQAAQGAGTPLDFTSVNAAVASLQTNVAANTADIATVAALVPAPVVAPPAA